MRCLRVERRVADCRRSCREAQRRLIHFATAAISTSVPAPGFTASVAGQPEGACVRSAGEQAEACGVMFDSHAVKPRLDEGRYASIAWWASATGAASPNRSGSTRRRIPGF